VRVLITGCGGYIGTTLTPYFLQRGYRVRCVDWLVFGEDVLEHVSGHPNFELIKRDVREIDGAVFSGVDAVIDLAAISNDPAGELDPELTLSINYRARVRNARLAAERGVSRYILASSCSIYGRQSGVVDETAQPNPLTTYARANLLAEREILPLASQRFAPVALRLATVYGPSRRMRFDLVVNAMTLTAYAEGKIYVEGDGTQMRPLVHVVDVARAVAFMLEQPPDAVAGQVFNVGSDDQNYRIIDVAKAVQKVVGGEIIFRGEIDRRSYAVSFARIRRLGWQPIYRVEEGVRQVYHELLLGHLKPEERWWTVKWYKRLLGK
jgi:nucleoside-diphosphate-sugar epimerase